MSYRKVGYAEQMWYILKFKIKVLPIISIKNFS